METHTCIAAISDKETTWIGADSAVHWNSPLTRAAEKKIIHKPYKVVTQKNGVQTRELLIGVTGPIRACNLLRYQLSLPQTEKGDGYIPRVLPAETRSVFKEHGLISKGGDESWGGGVLVATPSSLYRMGGGFGITELTEDFGAVGGGAEYSYGALTEAEPSREAVMGALSVAGRYDPYVTRPFHVESISTP